MFKFIDLSRSNLLIETKSEWKRRMRSSLLLQKASFSSILDLLLLILR